MAYAFQAGEAFLVNTETEGFQFGSAVTRLSNGGFAITWLDFANTGMNVMEVKAQAFDASGAKVGGEQLVFSQANASTYTPAIAGLRDGGFVVTWDVHHDRDGAGAGILGQIYNNTGARTGAEFVVNTRVENDQSGASVTGLTGGGFVVTWHGFKGDSGSSGGTMITGQLFDASGAKVGAEFLIDDKDAATPAGPRVTALNNEGFVVIWTEMIGSDVSTIDVRAQVFDYMGRKVGGEFPVATNTGGIQTYPNAAALSSGGFVVVWGDESGTLGDTSDSIKAQIFDVNGAKIGSEFLVNTVTLREQQAPTVTGLADGGFVVTWHDYSGSPAGSSTTEIKAQQFDAAGAKVGVEFQVNAITVADQYAPAVTMLTGGDYVITWGDYSHTLGDNETGSIKAQIFSIVIPPATDGDDSLLGTPDSDTIDGLGGNDTLTGNGGTDSLSGGAGNDTIKGMGWLDGGLGHDSIWAEAYAHSTVLGGDGNDTIFDEGQAALVDGGDGNDTIFTDSSLIYGGKGGDIIDVQSGGASPTVYGGDNADYIQIGATVDTTNMIVYGGDGNDIISVLSNGSGGTIVGGAGSDYTELLIGHYLTFEDFTAGDGGDRLQVGTILSTYLIPGLAPWVMVEQVGSDVHVLNTDTGDSWTTIAVLKNVNAGDLTAFNFNGVIPVARVTATEGNDTLEGSAIRDLIDGLGGDDVIHGNGGVDTLRGGAGNDTIEGQGGLIDGGIGNDHITATIATSATVLGGEGHDTIIDDGGAASIDGGAGNDTIDSYSALVHGGAGNDQIQVFSFGDAPSVYGGDGNDWITVNGGMSPWNMILDGGAGNDTINAGESSAGKVTTGAGSDLVIIAPGQSIEITDFTAGVGGDRLEMGNMPDYLRADFNVRTIIRQDGNDVLVQWDSHLGVWNTAVVLKNVNVADLVAANFDGHMPLILGPATEGNDTLNGDHAANSLSALGGNDWVRGFRGDDTLDGGAGIDSLYGGDDNDLLTGTVAFEAGEIFDGGAGSDTLSGFGDVSAATLTGIEQVTIAASRNLKVTVDQFNALSTVHFNANSGLFLANGGVVDLSAKATGLAVGVVASDAGNQITATTLNDVVYGGSGNDTLIGGKGNDSLVGGLGDDLYVFALGDGQDSIRSATAAENDVVSITGPLTIDDVTFSRSGNNMVVAYGTGGDAITLLASGSGSVKTLVVGGVSYSLAGGLKFTGTAGGDNMNGTNFNDTLLGLGGDDSLSGGLGDDVLIGGTGNDRMSGINGNDRYLFALGDGVDTVSGASTAAETDVLEITGALSLADVRFERSGWDLIIHYGAGSDAIVLSAHYDGDTTFPHHKVSTLVVGGVSYDLKGNLFGATEGDDVLTGSEGNDTLDGLGGADSLLGYGGKDTLRGGAGDDTLNGGAGADSLYGGAGDDSYYVDDAADKVHETAGQGHDSVYSSASWKASDNVEAVILVGYGNISAYGNALNNSLGGNFGNNTLSGADGNDVITGNDGNDKLDGGNGHDTLDGGTGNDALTGGDGSDSLDGGIGNDNLNGGARWDTLIGGAGNDILDGGSENDAMYGGVGDDTYVVDHVGDRVYENFNEGTDTVKALISYSLTADIEVLNLIGTDNIGGTGNGLHNAINGNSGNNGLNGGLGNDSLYGWDGDDSLAGGADHDRLSGGNGADTLIGGSGNDVLGGGADADDFVFSGTADNGHDHVVDFVHGVDRLVFTGADYGFAAGQVLGAADFTVGAAAVGSSAQFIWDVATRHLWFDADGDGAGAAVELALISGSAAVTKDDLYFV